MTRQVRVIRISSDILGKYLELLSVFTEKC